MEDITFVTGNQHKADMMAKLLERQIQHEKVDLDEIQTVDLAELVRHKVNQAYVKLQRPVIVDDFGFCIKSLNDLPGPFTKFFVQGEGALEKLCRIVDPLESRAATVVCAIAYKDAHTTEVFLGVVEGTVADHPRGSIGIDTDYLFEPAGYGGKTRAELSEQQYDEVYAKVRPITALKTFLDSYEN